MRSKMVVPGVLAFLVLFSDATAAGTVATAQPQVVAHDDGAIGRHATRDPAGPADEFTCMKGLYLQLVGLFWPRAVAPETGFSSGDILDNGGVGLLGSNGVGVWRPQ